MKQTLRKIIGASAVSVLAFSAVAQDAPRPSADRPAYTHERLPDGAEYNPERPGDRGDRMSQARQAEPIRGVAKASDIIGMTVKNRQDETLGKVTDLALDVESGRIMALIVSSGGFLGIGSELSAVPPTALRFNPDRDTLQLDASKEMLSNAPHFKADQWPDFGQPEYAGGIYRAYQVEPYFTTNTTTKVDNTARNVRDRNDATLTPFDQGNSKTDVATTAQIRKDIIAYDNMSVNGRNVKVITSDGRVTLRGPVDSAEEKRIIGEIANRAARSENVDNQLEVKLAGTTTTSSRN
jgi:hyperosmotically inducible periplasmic protein